MLSRQRCSSGEITQALRYIDMGRGRFSEFAVVPQAQWSKQFNTRVSWHGVVLVWSRRVVYMTRATRTAGTK